MVIWQPSGRQEGRARSIRHAGSGRLLQATASLGLVAASVAHAQTTVRSTPVPFAEDAATIDGNAHPVDIVVTGSYPDSITLAPQTKRNMADAERGGSVVIGIIAGMVLAALLKNNVVLVNFGQSARNTATPLYIAIAGFLAGFSERMVPDLSCQGRNEARRAAGDAHCRAGGSFRQDGEADVGCFGCGRFRR